MKTTECAKYGREKHCHLESSKRPTRCSFLRDSRVRDGLALSGHYEFRDFDGYPLRCNRWTGEVEAVMPKFAPLSGRDRLGVTSPGH
jgi:hypothetical protein